MREVERRVLLTVLDRKWREHLYEMDYLREGIGLRAMAQRDPLVEYQREGGDMFNSMMEAFMEEVVGFVFHLEVEVEPAAPQVGVVAGADGRAMQIGSRGERPATARHATARPTDHETGTATWSRRVPTRTAPASRSPRSRRSTSPELETGRLPAAGPGQGSRRQARRRMTYTSPDESGEAESGRYGRGDGRPVRRRRPQRPLPLRVGQEVQDVPRALGVLNELTA